MSFLNVSTYRFVVLDDLPALRDRLEATAQAAGLKGTILMAHEGINLFVAGEERAVRTWVATALHADARFAGLATKDSFSDAMPFQRLKVKIKDEIIRMNHPAIRPQQGRAPSVAPADLARWLAQGHDDAGREVALVDTRNAFEVDAGTFAGAHDWRIDKFSDFPAAFDAHRAELEGKTVVSFCTGGIRCEKAALYMAERALPAVLQLEGGILGYFAATGGAAPGWNGHCFVFDERRTVDAGLAPGGPPPSERGNGDESQDVDVDTGSRTAIDAGTDAGAGTSIGTSTRTSTGTSTDARTRAGAAAPQEHRPTEPKTESACKPS